MTENSMYPEAVRVALEIFEDRRKLYKQETGVDLLEGSAEWKRLYDDGPFRTMLIVIPINSASWLRVNLHELSLHIWEKIHILTFILIVNRRGVFLLERRLDCRSFPDAFLCLKAA